MHLLTNYPLELYGPRSEFPFESIVTFGPDPGHRIGDQTIPYDISFDASRRSIQELLSLVDGPRPDIVMLWWPDQEPIPTGLEDSEVPVVGVMSDYNLTLPFCRDLAPFFDLLLCDHSALPVLGRLPFARVEPWCQYSYRPDVHRPRVSDDGREPERDIDISFVGNLDPIVQRDRMPYLERIAALEDSWRVHIGSAPQGREYGELLARSRIAFNRSIRGEVNLRCFEATACGALLLCERENLEIRRYFREDEEVVLYGPHDLERKIQWLLTHEDERRRIADAGRRRVREHRLARQFEPLIEILGTLDVTRRPRVDDITRVLGRATSMLVARADADTILTPLIRCADLEVSARTRNALAVALVSRVGETMITRAITLLDNARLLDAGHLPSLANARFLRAITGDLAAANELGKELEWRARTSERPGDFDGMVMPVGFDSRGVAHAGALASCLKNSDLAPLRDYFVRLAHDDDRTMPLPGYSRALDPRELGSTHPRGVMSDYSASGSTTSPAARSLSKA
ncbi:MAG: glycosyltransferase family 1 protein [Planctomycetes bacterium]|nr:glycosyltransferase family 1 protein [Planctomycetota bacterium]